MRGMDLKTYLTPLDAEAREKLASQCGTGVGHLQNVMYGVRSCAPALAVLIERHSNKAVSRQELRPDDWHRIWPELIGKKGSPPVPPPQAVTSAESKSDPEPSAAPAARSTLRLKRKREDHTPTDKPANGKGR